MKRATILEQEYAPPLKKMKTTGNVSSSSSFSKMKKREGEDRKILPWTHSLRQDQIEHVDRLQSILAKKNDVAADGSPMGRGKTLTSLELARRMNLVPFILCPNSTAAEHWRRHAIQYGNLSSADLSVKVGEATVARPLDGSDKKWFCHYDRATAPKNSPVAQRVKMNAAASSSMNKNSNSDIVFVLRDEVRTLVRDQGALIILDECQHLKNRNTNRFQIAKLLADEVRASEGRSKMLLVSATFFDDGEKHHEAFLRLLVGETVAKNGSSSSSSSILCAAVSLYKRHTKDGISRQYEVLSLCGYNLLVEGLFPILKSEMPRVSSPLLDRGDGDGGGGERRNQTVQHKRILALDAVHTDEKLHEWRKNIIHHWINIGKRGDVRNIFDRLQEIEMEKAVPLADHIMSVYQRETGRKFIVYFNYLEPLEAFCDHIYRSSGGERPIVVTGDTPSSERLDAVAEFQSGGETSRRFFVATMKVMTDTVSLDDRSPDGSRPRTTYIMPSFQYLSTVQACGRTDDRGGKTTSDSVVFFVYSHMQTLGLELGIMRRLVSKSETLARLHDHTDVSTLPGMQSVATPEEIRSNRFSNRVVGSGHTQEDDDGGNCLSVDVYLKCLKRKTYSMMEKIVRKHFPDESILGTGDGYLRGALARFSHSNGWKELGLRDPYNFSSKEFNRAEDRRLLDRCEAQLASPLHFLTRTDAGYGCWNDVRSKIKDFVLDVLYDEYKFNL